MSFTLSDIRNRIIIDKLDDEDFDTSVVDNFINDTIRDIYISYELPFMEKIYSGTIPEGVYMISLPSDLSIAQSHVITAPDGSQLDLSDNFMPFREFNKKYPTPANNTAGYPHTWTSYAGKMIFSRPSDTEYTMDSYYIKTPTKLVTDSDVPGIPEEFEELIVLGAFARVQEREGDLDEAQVTYQEYARLLNKLVSRYAGRTSIAPIRMRNRQVGR